MKQTDRDSLQRWEEFKEDIYKDVPVEENLSRAEMGKQLARLEAHPIEWIKFFFPTYAKSEFADFQKKAIKRCLANDEWYEVLSWARSLSKSTVTMFIVMFLVLTGRRKNVIMASATEEAAIRLLKPYKMIFEKNGRLKAYYGNLVNPGNWKESNFILKNGTSFIGVGAGNAPRGSRNEAVRPDCLLVDDFDTDEACRNPDTVDKNWRWWEDALYFTRDPAVPTTIIFCGNIIAKDCCITRAGKLADHWDIVNIRDKNGKSTWPQKNTEEMIDQVISKVSTVAVQKEYFNNPISEGEIFKEITYGKVPSLKKFKFLVVYGDPAPGENKTKNSSTKGCWLCGKLDGKLYVIKGFLDRGLNAEFINWYISLNEYVDGRTTLYNFMENNKLQDPFFQQVFKPLVRKAKKEKRVELNINPDTEKKTDKATRIEANLEPLNREGNLIFNEDEQQNPHMQRLTDQFKLFTLRLKFPADGPDCIEGANRIIDRKMRVLRPGHSASRSTRQKNNKYRL